MKVLVDMNLSPTWTDYLRAAGYETHFWSSLGLPMSADGTILRYAADFGFIILTRDLDFGHLLVLENYGKPSVIQIRADLAMPADIGASVLLALRQYEEELRQGALVTIEIQKTRIRTLPFRVEKT